MREKEYGFEDMYSIADALGYAKVDSGSQYFDAADLQSVDSKVETIKNSIKKEKSISESYWSNNRGYSEREAKESQVIGRPIFITVPMKHLSVRERKL